MHDVFISYSWEEQEYAFWVADKMKEAGITCWMDIEKVKKGTSFSTEITQAIEECGVFVLMLSNKAQQSEWTPRELLLAMKLKKVILPFRIEKCKLQGKFVLPLININMYEAYEDRDKAIQNMIEQISKELSKPHIVTKQYDEGTYTGEYLYGNRQGKGKMTYTNGDTYEGDWKYDMRHGKGISRYHDGNIYDGEYKDNVKCGTGTFRKNNGSIYYGEFKDGLRSGHGTNRRYNGEVYTGEWQDNKYNGQGMLSYSNGNVYSGTWKEFNCHGTGTMIYKDGSVYIGEWKDNNRHGTGELTHPNGTKQSGQWKDDKFIG